MRLVCEWMEYSCEAVHNWFVNSETHFLFSSFFYKKKSSFGRVFCFLIFSFVATCRTGCVNGGCNYPGECYCNPGYSGPICASQTIASGINSCSFPNVTSPCNLANGQLLHDCPSGYSRITSEACPDIPGFDRNICGKTCCDGWTGADCSTRLF